MAQVGINPLPKLSGARPDTGCFFRGEAKAGGSVELVRHGWNGLLYRPGDADDLARQIALLYEDRVERTEIASRAQQWARERFTLERYGADLLTILTVGCDVNRESVYPGGSPFDETHTGSSRTAGTCLELLAKVKWPRPKRAAPP